MKRMATILLVCILGGFMLGCASVPKEIPETMRQACALYTELKPQIIAAREFAHTSWNHIPEEWKPTLLKLDGYLPELDRAGKAVCAASGAVAPLAGGRVDWDDVLSTVIKAAGMAAELRAKGVL